MNTEGRKLELLTEDELSDLLETLLSEKQRRNRVEELKTVATLSKALEDFVRLLPDENIYINVWCEECEENIEVDITEHFSDIAIKLDNLK